MSLVFDMAGMIQGEYEGELKGGVREGEGTLVWSNGDRYVGSFKNGLRHGKGMYQDKNGNVYNGNWSLSMRDGEGEERWGMERERERCYGGEAA